MAPSVRSRVWHLVEDQNEEEPPVNPAEDLMREHGLLRRVVLVYQEGIRRMNLQKGVPADVFPTAAQIVRTFIEDYHEKTEETFVFSKLKDNGILLGMCQTLIDQHKQGRVITDKILRLGCPVDQLADSGRAQLTQWVESFCHMYAAHGAFEDTVVFPAFRSLFTRKEFDALGERFEEQEHHLLGDGGLEGYLKQVSELEKLLNINEIESYSLR